MNSRRFRLVVLALLALSAVIGSMLAAPNVTAVPSPNAVVVVNGNDQPVPASIVGTPTVTVGGTVTVQPARQPFQQFVSAFSTGGEGCDSIDVPAGKRLALESLAVDADGPAGVEPDVYMRITASVPGGANFVRAVPVDLQPRGLHWAGVATVLLHTGTPAPGGHTFELDVCLTPGSRRIVRFVPRVRVRLDRGRVGIHEDGGRRASRRLPVGAGAVLV